METPPTGKHRAQRDSEHHSRGHPREHPTERPPPLLVGHRVAEVSHDGSAHEARARAGHDSEHEQARVVPSHQMEQEPRGDPQRPDTKNGATAEPVGNGTGDQRKEREGDGVATDQRAKELFRYGESLTDTGKHWRHDQELARNDEHHEPQRGQQQGSAPGGQRHLVTRHYS